MKILGKVEYLGTNYFGWQKQTNQKSIQEEIEKVLSHILNSDIQIYGSGRTDAGVHAKGQTFHFEVNKSIDLSQLRYSCNCLLPEDIHIVEMSEVDDDFHARFSAKGKHYSYTIYLGENNPFVNKTSYVYYKDFDLEKFTEALKLFDGSHCFKNFTSKEEDEANYVRTVRTDIVDIEPFVRVELYGDGFMRYMIRFLIGTAIAYMENRLSIEDIKNLLDENSDRKIVCYKAPSEGLVLEEVIY